MDHSFSADEIPNPLWTQQPPMQPHVGDDCVSVFACEDTSGHKGINGSSSEWSFEKLLEEELMGITTPPVDSCTSMFQIESMLDAVEVEPTTMTMDGVANPIEYNVVLKQKLEEDLAAIAMWRESSTVHAETSQGPYASTGGSINLVHNNYKNDRGHLVQNSYISSKLPARSSSSLSDDDDLDGEVEIVGFRMPMSEKMKKRKQSNRESARRSRNRKAARMMDLEDKVAHLRVENSTLQKRLDEINQKYNASTIDNRILRADMETLRTKVKMAEDTVNRLTGTTKPCFSCMPFFVGSSSHATSPPDPSVIVQDNNITNNYYTTASNDRVNNSYIPTMANPLPLQTEGVVDGSSNTNGINEIAGSNCAAGMGILQEMVSVMPQNSATGDGVAPWESASLGLDEIITDVDIEIEGHEDLFENIDILG